MKKRNDRFNTFSVSLGLLDYINPILYTITIVTIIRNIALLPPYHTILLIGGILSIFFGFIIPTGKVIVGLGIIKFKMPVILVFCVNTGIFLSGFMLFKYIFDIPLFLLIIIAFLLVLLLFVMYMKNKKMNTIAVLIGAFGYFMLYISLINLSIIYHYILPIILYGLAILLFIMLCNIGIKANLKNPKVHWVIEISNIICQFLVAISTILLFH